MGVAEGNVGLAWGCVIIAGLCTTIGSSFTFCSSYANKQLLAASLGISAGVMLYVSFAEIFCIKSVEGFEASGYGNATAIRYSTFCFFTGVAVTYFLDLLVVKLATMANPNSKSTRTNCGHSHDFPEPPIESGKPKKNGDGDDPSSHDHEMGNIVAFSEAATGAPDPASGMVVGRANATPGNMQQEDADKELQQMGLMTGIAIGLHNFPEGLATFVATLADSSLGISLAIAIAIHNIPEGICVAMPIYYATGSRWKGFWWSFLSGVSEPIGGLVGYAALAGSDMSDTMYGFLFGLVGGMMTYISLKELVPTALRYDPEDKVVSNCVMIGMMIMAASLLMFGVNGDDPDPTPCEQMHAFLNTFAGAAGNASDTMLTARMVELTNSTYMAAGCQAP